MSAEGVLYVGIVLDCDEALARYARPEELIDEMVELHDAPKIVQAGLESWPWDMQYNGMDGLFIGKEVTGIYKVYGEMKLVREVPLSQLESIVDEVETGLEKLGLQNREVKVYLQAGNDT